MAKAVIAVVLAALLGLLVWAVFFWFAFQTYFIDDEVDEAGPVFDSGAVAGAPVAEPSAPGQTPGVAAEPSVPGQTPGVAAEPSVPGQTPGVAAEPSVPGQTPGVAAEPDGALDATAAEATASASEISTPEPQAPAPAPDAGPMPGDELSEELLEEMEAAMDELGMPEEQPVEQAMPEMPQVRVEASGEFISRSHPTRGHAEVLGDGTGQRFLRFEEFRTDNGPDLNVYLSSAPTDAPAGHFDDDYVDLGDLKGNVGAQNYEIPRGLDLDQYSTVVIWCVRFSVIFGAAELVG